MSNVIWLLLERVRGCATLQPLFSLCFPICEMEVAAVIEESMSGIKWSKQDKEILITNMPMLSQKNQHIVLNFYKNQDMNCELLQG